MSKKISEIKNKVANKQPITPTAVLNEVVGKEEKNVSSNEEKKIERKRVSFDLRSDLHKQLKIQSIVQEKNIYNMIEEAVEDYLKKL